MYPVAKMEGPLSVFGDRSTGEAIRSQNGKGKRGLGLAGGTPQPRAGRGHRPCAHPYSGKGARGEFPAPPVSPPRSGAGRQSPVPVGRSAGELPRRDAVDLGPRAGERSWGWSQPRRDTCRPRLNSPWAFSHSNLEERLCSLLGLVSEPLTRKNYFRLLV